MRRREFIALVGTGARFGLPSTLNNFQYNN